MTSCSTDEYGSTRCMSPATANSGNVHRTPRTSAPVVNEKPAPRPQLGMTIILARDAEMGRRSAWAKTRTAMLRSGGADGVDPAADFVASS